MAGINGFGNNFNNYNLNLNNSLTGKKPKDLTEKEVLNLLNANGIKVDGFVKSGESGYEVCDNCTPASASGWAVTIGAAILGGLGAITGWAAGLLGLGAAAVAELHDKNFDANQLAQDKSNPNIWTPGRPTR